MRSMIRGLAAACLCATLLAGCAGLDLPGLTGTDPASALGQGMTDIVNKASSITDKGLEGLAKGADFYCDNAPAVARSALRSAVNAKMAAKGSQWQLGDFCLPASPGS